MTRDLRPAVVWGTILFVCGAAWFCILTSGCASGVAAATYDAQQIACVDRFDTRDTIDLCRHEVNLRWHRGPDGGRLAEGGAP